MNERRYQSIQEFWGFYVQQHQNPLTRRLHFVGNTNLFFWLLLALWKRDWRLLAWAVASSYGLAWVGHFFVEHNKPATFKYPVMSAICDMLMYYKMWQGTMDAEVAKYASAPDDTQREKS
jgi:hypothetical protein